MNDLTAQSPELIAHLRGIAAAPSRFGSFPGLAYLHLGTGLSRDAAETMLTALAADFTAAIENRAAVPDRLAALRGELTRLGLQGLIVPLTDEYHGEYIPPRAQRLTWLTGFSGSAGLCIVLADQAAVWSDGRYTLQLRQQVDAGLFELLHLTDQPPTDWLKARLRPGDRLGYDAWLHTEDSVKRFSDAAGAAGAELVAVSSNPVDAVWQDQPPPPLAPILPHADGYAGRSAADKLAELSALLKREQVDAVLLTLPESIAWLLNLRGGDVKHTPLPLSLALVDQAGTVDLFVDPRKLPPETHRHLGAGVRLHPRGAFDAALDALGRAKRVVRVDPATAGAYPLARLRDAGATLRRADDPCLLPKACKNAVELAGIRAAHRRDGAAMCRFLAWLSETAPAGGLDELEAEARLQAFRRLDNSLNDLSFSSISGAGPNGAVVHYRASAATNRKLEPGQLYLIDSGGQYPDGTTDITRTVYVAGTGALARPATELRENFTRVLKGHIALAMAMFPDGTSGQQLDALARYHLWQAGLDYDHGTGHGVGAYLSVHEGPHRIAKLGSPVPLRPGMIVSNEPGYYKAGAYGIRIENLVAVRVALEKGENGKAWYSFETLTRAPIDRSLVDTQLLSAAELAWLNGYHATVLAEIGPMLDPPARAWLQAACANIS